MSKLQKFFSINEAADLLRVSPWTVKRWFVQGRLRRTKVGKRTVVSKSDLEAFLESCNVVTDATSVKPEERFAIL